MDGSAKLEPGALGATLAYLSRLIGEDVTPDQRLALRSIHRVALATWARQEQLSINGGLINSGAPFSIRELLGAQTAAAASQVSQAAPVAAPDAAATALGIDIEEVASLPVTDDYREHPFFRENFTPAEISYCVRQPDARVSFCGTWAAKEAVLKAGAPGAALARLIDVEIERDRMGRPGYANCAISISHTGQTAVAVCLRQPPVARIEGSETPVERQTQALPIAPVRKGRGALAGAILLLIATGLVIYWLAHGLK